MQLDDTSRLEQTDEVRGQFRAPFPIFPARVIQSTGKQQPEQRQRCGQLHASNAESWQLDADVTGCNADTSHPKPSNVVVHYFDADKMMAHPSVPSPSQNSPQVQDSRLLDSEDCTLGSSLVLLGSHHLPVEEGRHFNLPRASRVCNLCNTDALGDERHMLLECPALADLRLQFSSLLLPCAGVMRRLLWAKDQHEVCRYIIACLDRMSSH